jgi:hypothetical protein
MVHKAEEVPHILHIKMPHNFHNIFPSLYLVQSVLLFRIRISWIDMKRITIMPSEKKK